VLADVPRGAGGAETNCRQAVPGQTTAASPEGDAAAASPGPRSGHVHPVPQDPTACRGSLFVAEHRSHRQAGCTWCPRRERRQLVSDPPMSPTSGAFVPSVGLDRPPQGRRPGAP